MKKILVLVGATALVQGCMIQRDYQAPRQESDFDFFSPSFDDDGDSDFAPEQPRFSTARNPFVRGDVGPAQVSQAPDETNLYDDGWYTTLELVAVQPTRVAMVQLTVDDPDVLTPGTTRTVTANDWDSGVSLLACTGSEVGMYDEYDAPADEVVIVVEEGTTEGEVEVEVTGRWYDRDELGNPQGGSRVATAEATLVP